MKERQNCIEAARSGWMDFDAMPGEPTTCRPGTEEKLEVMRRRVERGEQICHPLDPVDEHAVPGELFGERKPTGFESALTSRGKRTEAHSSQAS